MSRFSPIRSSVVSEPATEVSPPDDIQAVADSHPSAPSVCTVTLTFNPAKNGLQLHFPDKPDEAIRSELKAAGWRWSFHNHCWYHRDTPANRDFAECFVARLNAGEPAAPAPDVSLSEHIKNLWLKRTRPAERTWHHFQLFYHGQLVKAGQQPFAAQTDANGNCLTCGENGNCPGWHYAGEFPATDPAEVPPPAAVPQLPKENNLPAWRLRLALRR